MYIACILHQSDQIRNANADCQAERPRPLNVLSKVKASDDSVLLVQWILGLTTPKGLRKNVLNSEVVLIRRLISLYRTGQGTKLAVLTVQVTISTMVLITGFTLIR